MPKPTTKALSNTSETEPVAATNKAAKESKMSGARKGTDKKTKKESKAAKAPVKALPVTLLSGFLGAGKTTLLKNILESKEHGFRIAVVVNDMAELNIDSSLVKKAKLVQTKQEFISLQNGCICCTLRHDLIREIQRIHEMNAFDYLIIESTGIAEPMHVAENFVLNPENHKLAEDQGLMLHAMAKLDTCVTVVDASEFSRKIASLRSFVQEYPSEVDSQAEEGLKNVSQLLIEQIEFANVIILNKCDLLRNDSAVESEIIPLIRTLNPKAKVITSSHCRVDLRDIMNTGLFSMEEAQTAAGWLQSLKADHVVSEKDEYGIFSFVYRARKPFHPSRLHGLLRKLFVLSDPWKALTQESKHELLPASAQDGNIQETELTTEFGSILRSKGFCWVATRDATMIEWNHHGRHLDLNPLMQWYSFTPEKKWGLDKEEIEQVKKDFVPPYGDRRQELVIIGIDLQKDAIAHALNDCLLTDEELRTFTAACASAGYSSIERHALPWVDPLPAWPTPIQDTSIFACVARAEEENILLLPEGMELTITHLSLDVTSDDCTEATNESLAQEPCSAIKLWLEIASPVAKRILLCTFRPGGMETLTTNIPILAEPHEREDDDHDHNHDHAHDHNHDHDHAHEEASASNGEDDGAGGEDLPLRITLEFVKLKKRKAAQDIISFPSSSRFEVHVVGTARWNMDSSEETEEE